MTSIINQVRPAYYKLACDVSAARRALHSGDVSRMETARLALFKSFAGVNNQTGKLTRTDKFAILSQVNPFLFFYWKVGTLATSGVICMKGKTVRALTEAEAIKLMKALEAKEKELAAKSCV